MKPFFNMFCYIFTVNEVLAQENSFDSTLINVSFFCSDSVPEFKGGFIERQNYLQQRFDNINIKSKTLISKRSIEINIRFTVTRKVNIRRVTSDKKGTQLYFSNQEQQRIIKAFYNMPKWIPGKIDGEPKRVRILQPLILSN